MSTEKIASLENYIVLNERPAFDKVISELGKDRALDSQIFMLLAKLSDSRALFPLINYTTKSKDSELTQRLIQYMTFTKDPRSEDFLYNYLGVFTRPFITIAQEAFRKCHNNFEFLYQFAGSNESYKNALKSNGGIQTTSQNLTYNEKAINENKLPAQKPQTYVITPDRKMLIGVNLNEHVSVAKGQDVYAAGEVDFEKTEAGWQVVYINNRSNGYIPHSSCFHWVKQYLMQTDISFVKEEFDETFPRNGFNDSDFLSVQMFGDSHS